MVLAEVMGEDLMRLDWRAGVVDSEVRFKGVELEEVLGKWDRRCGMMILEWEEDRKS